MKIVVTGGAGFIASHIVDAYIRLGHEVYVIDDFSTGQSRNLNPSGKVFNLDIADPKAAKSLAEIKPDVLNHHAAQMDVRRSVADPTFDARINIIGFINLLEACKDVGVKKIIFSSSGGAVYGDREPIPATEEHETLPLSPYGVSKLTGELYLGYYHMAFGLPYVALRYANVYGPRQSTLGEAGVVAIFIAQLLAGKTPVINGDGKQTRDYVFVGDVVRANVAALDVSFSGAVNIGAGKETDVVTICELLRDGIGSPVEAIHGPAKLGEQRRSCLETALARKVLGWRPEVGLKEGLQQTIAYYREAGPA
ncbi:MAG TPA: NAD-dependent epimerase/dehydratase family protein [Candidatus Binatia bacterium]|nr:NAD-dependent epimerase/dehydratase family protein [Candidatus Binatia bacterium]